jgi:hypothetical protein
VAAFFDGAGDTQECFVEGDAGVTTPSIVTSHTDSTLRVFDPIAMCFAGFSESQPVAVQVLQPDGKIRRETLSAGSALEYYFEGMPTDPLGEYIFTVTQDATEASLRLRLVPAAEPSQKVVLEGPTSRPTDVALSGFSPRENISLHFYGGRGPHPQVPNTQNAQLPYITTVVVQADDNGQATYPWPTDSEKDGCYGVRAAGVESEQPLVCQ